MPRPVITIDEEKCNGCGQCILDCAEGALAIVDGKAKLLNEVYCDGLGACLNCPQGALTLAMKDAPPFDGEAALNAKKQRGLKDARPKSPMLAPLGAKKHMAALRAWPLQLELVPPNAAFLRGAPVLLAAHCAGFASPDIHKWMSGRVPLIACPKLENKEVLADKLAAIIREAETPAIDILRMSVPCCALPQVVEKACAKTAKKPEIKTHIINLA